MRERTTWNRDSIRTAAYNRTADPYTMNQDHPQPGADDYTIGDSSDFAEDVSPNRWESEYSGGAVRRNEIGMPEFRAETFKSAAPEVVLLKKADLTLKVARLMLPKTASEAAVEDQAYSLMYMPDAELVGTFDRLANDGQPQQQVAQGQQQQVAQDQQQQVAQGQQQQVAQGQQQQVADQGIEAMVAQAVQQAMQQQQCACKTAQDQEQEGQEQAQQAQQQAQQKQARAIKALVDQQVAQAMQQQQAQQQGQPQQQVAQGQQQQVAQGQQQQVSQGQQMPPVQGDDALLDEMLMGPDIELNDVDQGQDFGIEMEAPIMDTGDVVLGPEDDALRSLFANQETEDAEQAQQAQDQGQQQKQASVRTASTRTVGTRPSQGVSRVGGVGGAVTAPSNGGGEVNKLASLWTSAPDVRDAFGINR